MNSCLDSVQDIVASLLEVPLSKRTPAERRIILATKSPTPNLCLRKRDGPKWRTFHATWYDIYPWLCGSTDKNKLFCWPCLLQPHLKSVWNSEGFANLKSIAKCLKTHNASKAHLNNFLDYKELHRRALWEIDTHAKESKMTNSAEIKMNRKCIKQLIKLICTLIKQDVIVSISHLVDNEVRSKALWELALNSDEELRKHWQQKAFPKKIQIDLMACIREEIDNCIEKEVNDSPFFACFVDEVEIDIDANEKPQCSITVRHVNKSGNIQEYCLGLFDLVEGKSAVAMHKLLLNVLGKFDMKRKLVGLSNLVSTEPLDTFRKLVKESAPLVSFTHRSLNDVLQLRCCNTASVKVFFSTLNSIPAFFNESSERRDILNRICSDSVAINNDSNVLSALLAEREKLLLVFDEIVKHPDSSLVSVRQAESLKRELQEWDFIFYLTVFTDIFLHTEPLLNVYFCSISIHRLVETLESWKSDVVFSKYVHATKRTVKESISRNMAEYKMIFFEILDNVAVQLKQRLSDYEKLDFLQLGDPKQFLNRCGNSIVQKALDSLMDTCGVLFDRTALKAELETLFWRVSKAKYHEMTLAGLIRKMNEDEINEVLPECYKLFCLISTISVTGPSCSRDGLSLLIDMLMNDNAFYSNIIKKFAKRNDTNLKLNEPTSSNRKRAKLDEHLDPSLDQPEFAILDPADSEIKIEKHELEEEQENTMDYDAELSAAASDQVKEEVVDDDATVNSDSATRSEMSQPEARHPIQTFFDSMATTVIQFPPPLAVRAKVEVLQVVSKLELEAWDSQSRPNT